jgi:hypothetical protein
MSTFDRTAKEVEKAITHNGGKSANAKVNPERQREIHADYRDADGLAHHLVLLCGPQHDHYANIEADVQRLMASRHFQVGG